MAPRSPWAVLKRLMGFEPSVMRVERRPRDWSSFTCGCRKRDHCVIVDERERERERGGEGRGGEGEEGGREREIRS